MFQFSLFLIVFLGLSPSLIALENAVMPSSNTKINLDGRDLESFWEKATPFKNFTQNSPREGVAPSQKTRLKISYDQNNIYLFFQSFDSDPKKISKILTRRDQNSPSDWVDIYFDTFLDGLSAYQFSISAAGVLKDCRISEGHRKDFSWNAVWEAEVFHHEKGWNAEIIIPLSQMAFNHKSKTWGFQAARVIARENEINMLFPLPRHVPNEVQYFGKINFPKGLKKQLSLQLIPYFS